MSQAAGSGPNFVMQGIPPGDQELHREVRVKMAEYLWSLPETYNQLSATYGQHAVRGTFLANGAAIVAILALLGSLHAKQTEFASLIAGELFGPVLLFSVGIFSSLVASGLGYLNYQFIAESVAQIAEVRDYILYNKKMELWGREHQRKIVATARIAVVCVVASVAAFLGGAVWAGKVISRASPPKAAIANQCKAVVGMDGKHYHLLFCPLEAEQVVSKGSTNGP